MKEKEPPLEHPSEAMTEIHSNRLPESQNAVS